MKAFCGKCAHLGDRIEEVDFDCDHPLNFVDDFYAANRVRKRTAADLNQFNDCPGYEPEIKKS